ncbi:MAG: acetate--CoA ligase family protein [Candidatus Aenigmarchaeota archaeon]|nr:acetate--CoA ligase family protein [Candidatus Aenigmarchaeota archaeon]
MKKLTEFEAKKILKKYGIPVTKEVLAKTPNEAAKLAKKIGYPVAMKIQSPDMLHKTDVGGVVLDVKNDKEVLEAYDRIIKNAKKHDSKAKILGIVVQEMLDINERKCIIGSNKDPQFGPVIMFGLGGIFVEVLKDVSFRIIPIERKDAKEMISEIKTYEILKGVRGQKPINFKALEDTLLKVSKMVWKEKNLDELDINPLFVGEWGVKAADARMIFK